MQEIVFRFRTGSSNRFGVDDTIDAEAVSLLKLLDGILGRIADLTAPDLALRDLIAKFSNAA